MSLCHRDMNEHAGISALCNGRKAMQIDFNDLFHNFTGRVLSVVRQRKHVHQSTECIFLDDVLHVHDVVYTLHRRAQLVEY